MNRTKNTNRTQFSSVRQSEHSVFGALLYTVSIQFGFQTLSVMSEIQALEFGFQSPYVSEIQALEFGFQKSFGCQTFAVCPKLPFIKFIVF